MVPKSFNAINLQLTTDNHSRTVSSQEIFLSNISCMFCVPTRSLLHDVDAAQKTFRHSAVTGDSFDGCLTSNLKILAPFNSQKILFENFDRI